MVVAALHSRWFACARHGAVSMPRRSARLALQRERAESRPVEPVSIPLDDDTDSLQFRRGHCCSAALRRVWFRGGVGG